MRSELPTWDGNPVFKCSTFITDGGNQRATHTKIYEKRNLSKY